MGESQPEGSERNAAKRQQRDAGQQERSGANPEKRQRSDVGRDAGQQDEARRRQKIQRQLDEALADSFPASDPVSIVTSNEEEDWGDAAADPAPTPEDRAGANPNPKTQRSS